MYISDLMKSVYVSKVYVYFILNETLDFSNVGNASLLKVHSAETIRL